MFIAFDGIDGSGKSTILDRLMIDLKNKEYEVSLLDFGGGSIFKQILREIRANKNTLPRIREMVFYFEGLHTYINDIKPFRSDKNKILIIDRYLLTYYVYGQLNGMNKEDILFFTKNIEEPDLYFYLDNEPDVALDRVLKSRDYINPAETGYSEYYHSKENFDAITKERKIDMFLKYQAKATELYRNEFNSLKSDKLLVDSTKNPEEVYRNVMEKIQQYLCNL